MSTESASNILGVIRLMRLVRVFKATVQNGIGRNIVGGPLYDIGLFMTTVLHFFFCISF